MVQLPVGLAAAGGALTAAQAKRPGGAACGGAVLLAPELVTAALPVNGLRAQPPG